MARRSLVLTLLLLVAAPPAVAGADTDAVKSITIRAPRDIGFFAGDLVPAEIDIDVAPAYSIDEASLPRPGPLAYWLDLRSIRLASKSSARGARRYTLHVLYQNFYDSLDARQQEIPAMQLRLTKGKDAVSANVPAWTIGVSPLREVAPPAKDDPKDYLRADATVPPARSAPFFWSAGGALLAALLAVVPLAADRAWFPFQQRPARVLAAASRALRRLEPRAGDTDAYIEALLLLHRGLDETFGQRLLADDVPVFLARHPAFAPARDGLLRFFAASRRAFFASDLGAARTDLDFQALRVLAGELAAIERTAS